MGRFVQRHLLRLIDSLAGLLGILLAISIEVNVPSNFFVGTKKDSHLIYAAGIIGLVTLVRPIMGSYIDLAFKPCGLRQAAFLTTG